MLTRRTLAFWQFAAFTTFAGVIFAALRLWSGSLLAPMGAHLASNSFAYVGAIAASEL